MSQNKMNKNMTSIFQVTVLSTISPSRLILFNILISTFQQSTFHRFTPSYYKSLTPIALSNLNPIAEECIFLNLNLLSKGRVIFARELMFSGPIHKPSIRYHFP